MFGEILPEMQNFLPAILAVTLSFLISTNAITAPSISLEGRNIWQLKALPISVKDVFAAKKKVHYYITGIPTLIAVLAFCYCCGLSPVDSLLLILFAVVYLMFSATSGLAAGLRFPNMKWTDETMVIKRGAPVFISLFGGWAIGTVIGLGLYFGRKFMSARLMMVVMIVLFLAADLLIDRWMNTKGIDRFMEL